MRPITAELAGEYASYYETLIGRKEASYYKT